jgi:arylsulfatase
VRGPMLRLIRNFQESLKQHPPIPPGAPDDFVP